jgi:integrase
MPCRVIVWVIAEGRMAGRRPLNQTEERQLLRLVRKLHPRNRALITTQWFTGFRIHEILSLTVASVLRNGSIVSQIGITPRFLKGNFGRTRWVPVLPELHRALTKQLWWLDRKFGLRPDLPLFPSRKRRRDGVIRAICRTQAHDLVKEIFRLAGIEDDGRLGTHSLRKTFARNVYKHSGNDLMVLKAALHHSDVDTTQKYLETREEDVVAAITKCDFTRRGRQRREQLPAWGTNARWPRARTKRAA